MLSRDPEMVGLFIERRDLSTHKSTRNDRPGALLRYKQEHAQYETLLDL